MPRFHKINGEHIQFTVEEEAARDAEEAQDTIDRVVQEEAKLADDSITFDELKELMRLRG